MLFLAWLAIGPALLIVGTHRWSSPFPQPPPDVSWGHWEQLRLTTNDGLGIGAWHLRGNADLPPVLIVHGNGGDRSHCLKQAEMVTEQGHPVLLIAVRAHGDSDGTFNDLGYSARWDVKSACDFLAKEYPGAPVVLMGQSLGAAAVLYAARDFELPVAGMILDAPYAHLVDSAMYQRGKIYFPPVLFELAFASVKLSAPMILGPAASDSPRACAAKLPGDFPVLLIAGGMDLRAPASDAKELAMLAGTRARLEVFETAGHGEAVHQDPERFRRVIGDLLRDATKHAREIDRDD